MQIVGGVVVWLRSPWEKLLHAGLLKLWSGLEIYISMVTPPSDSPEIMMRTDRKKQEEASRSDKTQSRESAAKL